jgi:hypothetical protein
VQETSFHVADLEGGKQMLRAIMMTTLTAMPLAAALSGPVSAATYYVDQDHPQASDDNAGTEESPWKTINHAAKVLRAGDTVVVKKGIYDVGVSANWATPAVAPVNAGTVDAPITFQACRGQHSRHFRGRAILPALARMEEGGQASRATRARRHRLGASAVAYLEYNFYDAPSTYDFGENTSNHQRLSLGEMRAAGLEGYSRVVSRPAPVWSFCDSAVVDGVKCRRAIVLG